MKKQTPIPPWIWALLGIGILLIGGVFGYAAFLTREINARLREIRQAGYPITGVELGRWYPNVPDQENAALTIMQAAAALSTDSPKVGRLALPGQIKRLSPDRKTTFEQLKWPGRTERLSPDRKTTFEQVLADNAPALKKLREGDHVNRSRYPVEFTKSLDMPLPHLAQVKALAQLLSVEAILAWEAGKPERAVQAIADTLYLARSLVSEPLLISQLVRGNCLRIASSTVARLLSQRALTEEQLETLWEGFTEAATQNPKAFTRGLIGERCQPIHWFKNSSFSPALYLAGVVHRDFLFYLSIMDEWIKSSELPFPESLLRGQQASRRFEKAVKQRRSYVCSRAYLPVVGRAVEDVAEVQGNLRCIQAALAVERFRLKNGGQLPANLDQLVPAFLPEVLGDPIDGKPIRYKRAATGYLIYSVGKDGIDNGGLERAKKTTSEEPHDATPTLAAEPYDVTFTVER